MSRLLLPGGTIRPSYQGSEIGSLDGDYCGVRITVRDYARAVTPAAPQWQVIE
jgi:hypothetical protein